MKIDEILKFLEEHRDIKIFHIRHFHILKSIPISSLKVSLYRLTKKGIIKRVCKGYYANPFNLPTIEEIGTTIYYPSYVSLESALYYWGILSQIPQVLTMVTIKLPYKINTSFGLIEYRQIKKDKFWGYIKKNGFLIAEPEKAILDYIYLNKNYDKIQFNLKDLKIKKLRIYAKKMGLKIDF